MTNRKYKNFKEYSSNYLGGWSFEEGDRTLTIRDVSADMVRDPKTNAVEEKICVYFEEEEKPLILNATNNDTISKVVGSSLFANWIGKRIIIGGENIRAFGDVFFAVRVRNEKPKEVTDPITNDQKAVIDQLIESGAVKLEPMLKYYKIHSIWELGRDQAADLIRKKSGVVDE